MRHTAPGPVKAPVRPHFVQTALMLALAGAGLLAGSAGAQQVPAADPAANQPADDGPVATVTVSGVRKAAQSSQEIKRKSDQVIDSIVADDIGKFPDNNVAETLARVTGIQIRRDSGEASAVLIRGLPDVVTLLNGRELFTTTGRYVNLADIPATMLQRVDVYKSQGPDQVEGGVAGIIDVRTNRPFDFKGYSASVNTRAVYSDKSKSTDPNISAMVSNRWKTDIGEFGALVGLSFQERNYHEERAFNTAPIDKSFLAPNLTAPDEVGLIAIKGDRRRSAANTALQWRPNKDMEFYFEGMATRDRTDSGTDFFVGLPWWNDGTGLSATTIPGTNQLQTLTAHNANTIMSTQANAIDSLTQQYAIGGMWDITPQWHGSSEIATTRSRFDWRNPILDTVIVVPNAVVNTNQNGSINVNYSGIDLTNPSNYYLKGFFDRYGHDKGDATDWRADLAYTPEADGLLKELSFGARAVDRKAESIKSFEGNAEAPDVTTGTWPYTRQNASTIPGLSCLSDPLSTSSYGLTQWYTPCSGYLLNNTAAIRQAITGTTAERALDPGSFFKDVEKSYALYAKAKLGFQLGAIPVDGVVGVRVVKTKQTLQGNSTQDGVYTPVTSENTSTDWLPSMALKLMLRPDVIGRLTAGRTITRPGFSQLNPGLALINSSETVQATGSGGNPNLKPVKADNFDAALEWYFAPAGSLNATLFHHRFDGYIESRKAAEIIGGISYDVTRPYNTANGYLQGLEVGYQQFYDKLPGFLGGLGLQLNGTYMHGLTTDDSGTKPITGVSRYSYNVVGLYERGGWSARLAYNWRGKFVDTYDQGGPGLDLIVAPTKQLDGSVSYKINSHLSVTLDAVNLLDTKFKDYWNLASVYPRDTRRYDRTVGLALRWSN